MLARRCRAAADLRFFIRRDSRPSRVFAAGEQYRFRRSRLAPARVCQRAQLQLEFAGQRRRARFAQYRILGAVPSLAARNALVRDVPVSRRVCRQLTMLARRIAVGRSRSNSLNASRNRRHAMPPAYLPRRGTANFWGRYLGRGCRSRCGSNPAGRSGLPK